MPKLKQLKISAVKSANARGHILKRFESSWPHNGGEASEAFCAHCKAWVQVKEKPYPNEIDIGGNAVAVNCPKTN